MRKKIILMLGCMLFSCGGHSSSMNVQNDLPIIESSAFNQTFIDISKGQLKGKIANEDTFLLFLYSSSCFSCEEFKPIINNYITYSHAIIYGIDIDKENLPGDNELAPYISTPSLFLFNRGEQSERYDSSTDIFNSLANFEHCLSNIVKLSRLYKVNNESELDALIATQDNIKVYFYLSTCNDCLAFSRLYFTDRIEKLNHVIYGFEVQEYFKGSDEMYRSFTKKYGLSLEGNSKFGYRGGVVPTIQCYSKAILTDARVIYNDVLDKEYNDLGELLSVEVKSSYYSDSPYINHVFNSSSEKTAKDVYQEETLEFFIKKVEEIL